MTIRKDLNGLRIQKPGTSAIYLVDEGMKRHIPDPETYDGLFRDWNGVVQDLDIDDISTGDPLDHGATLVRGDGDPAVYLVDHGHKRHIGNPATMDRYHLEWDTVKVVPPVVVAAIPTGAQILWI